MDFRSVNYCTKSPKTVALPSIQSIENTFSQAYVSTLDIQNMFPSIKLTPSSYKYFNFYFGDKILTHTRLPQGWCSSVFFATKATEVTFDQSTLEKFKMDKHLTEQEFPYSTYAEFLNAFVDDLTVFSPKDRKNAIRLHLLCIEAVLFALKYHGWLIHLSKCTFLTPNFTFHGLAWNISDQTYQPLNNRLQAIKEFRPPQSIPECLSRISSFSIMHPFCPS